jgi:hypothetical protein
VAETKGVKSSQVQRPVLLEDPQEGDGWALWAAKPLDRGLEIFLLEVAACDISRVVGQPYLAGLWKGCPSFTRDWYSGSTGESRVLGIVISDFFNTHSRFHAI